MKIKIKDTVYDSSIEPVMIILDDTDKQNIRDMLPECFKYCSYPEFMEEKIIREFMRIN